MIRFAAALAAVLMLAAPASAQTLTVAVVAVDNHSGVEGCLEGLRDALPAAGYVDGDNVRVTFDTPGDGQSVEDLVRQVVEADPAVIVPVSTAAAQAVDASTDDIPIVFCAVADPVSSGLAADNMRPGGQATGVSDRAPLAEQLALINEVVPEVRRLGVPYNPADPSSVAMVERLQSFAPGAGFEIVEAQVEDPAAVEQVVRDLVDQVEAIYLPPDESVLAAFDSVLAIAEEAEVPLFAANAELVERGAVGSLGFDYVEVGRQTAALVARVLKGESPSGIPIIQAESTFLVVNANAAERMGVELSPGFVARTNAVVD